MALSDLAEKLNLSDIPDSWNEFYNYVISRAEKSGVECIDEENILKLNNEYHLFDEYLDVVLKAANEIRTNENLTKYLALLCYALNDRSKYLNEVKRVVFPENGEKESLAYDLMPMFAILTTVPKTVEIFRKRNVSEEIILKTLTEYENVFRVSKLRFGRPLCNRAYFYWLFHMIDAKLIQVGGLAFELGTKFRNFAEVFENKNGDICVLAENITIHKSGMPLGLPGFEDDDGAYDADYLETDEYFEGYPSGGGKISNVRKRLLKSEWKKILTRGDNAVSVHIPRGVDISKKTIEKTFKDAIELFDKSFPDYDYNVFTCESWLMDKELSKLLKPTSKILEFQTFFEVTANPRSSGKEVFSFVFTGSYDDYSDLPENTSLERNLKKHYLNGKYIYAHHGFVLKNKL